MTDQSLHLTLAATPHAGASHRLLALGEVDRAAWESLCDSRIEGNGQFDPGFAVPAFGLAGGGKALLAFDAGHRLTGLLPVAASWQVAKLPLPMLVARPSYTVLAAPLLDRDDPVGAAEQLLEAAQRSGAAALMIPDLPLDGAAADALRAAMARRGVAPVVDNIRQRGALDATGDAEAYLRASLGGKRLREIRRLGTRMADAGVVAFTEARSATDVAAAVERFLPLEASGWKGARGTALGQNAADAGFIRRAAIDLAARDRFSVLELWLDTQLLAAGFVIRQGDHALFFKIAFDEAYSRFSPGVQLTLELTRRLCADPAIRWVNSAADEGHTMMEHIWRERFRIADVFVPTGRQGLLFAAIARVVIVRRKARQRLKGVYHRIRALRR